MSLGNGGGPVRLSQMIGSPTFRSAATNTVAVIPLLSSSHDGKDDPNTHSSRSFDDFLSMLHQHNRNSTNSVASTTSNNSNVVVVVPNSNLTRPSDWKYNETPLKNFHWGHGCQRLRFFDGRPYHSRHAHDRLINHELTRNWIDLCPSRRTAALIGVLNVRDCPDQATLETALQEWKQWAERYSTPPYEVTAHGRDVGRDTVVPRLFVFDSFHEDFVNNPNTDLEAASEKLKLSKNCLVAFPPADQNRSEMMDLHMNVVVNDLTVAIFREIEGKIRESDALMTTRGGSASGASTQGVAKKGLFGRANSANAGGVEDDESPMGSKKMSIDSLAAVVSSTSELASPKRKDSTRKEAKSDLNSSAHSAKGGAMSAMSSSVTAQLLTPLDEFLEYTELSPKDAHMMMKRQVARRHKFTADLCLLAGSPLDAYERYTKAADLSKSISPDPLWYASALEGCAAAHIAMADVGGFNVDEYLDSFFQLPEELMACALVSASDSSSSEKENKKSMPQVITVVCEEALNVTSRHPKIACFYAELLLKLAWYTAEVEDVHTRCLWGMGGDDDGTTGNGEEYCYGGDPNNDKRRWEMAAATRLNFLDLKNNDGEDVVMANTLKRCQKCSEFMHRAAAAAALDPLTRADVALRCLAISWRGIRPTVKPTGKERSNDRIQLKRKAAFFAVIAAEAMSDVHGAIPNERASAMWMQASRLLSKSANNFVNGGNYGWATLRAVALHAMVINGTKESSEEAARQLLMLVSEISPPNKPSGGQLMALKRDSPLKRGKDDSGRSYSISRARTYMRDTAKQVGARWSGVGDLSSFVVVQSKWVEDDPLEPAFVPMGDFSSDFALGVLELPSVWSTIRFEHCSVAQERLLQQIYDLRKTIPASTLQHASAANSQVLPIEITAISIVSPDSSLKLERVAMKSKKKPTEQNSAMATFFNPYAKQQKTIKPTTIPRGEEQSVSITFTNKLSIPFEIDACRLEFDAPNSGSTIKAPSISFVVPGHTKNYSVRFPFIVLDKLKGEDEIDTLEVKGIHITALSRAIFIPVGSPKEGDSPQPKAKDPVIPPSTSLYERRDYTKKSRQEDQTSSIIQSPRLEITPQQPKLRVSFASAPIPMDDESIIPVLLADGEIFTLPKMCVSNDTGLDGLGTIEELQISAVGLPGLSEVTLYDMSSSPLEKKDVTEEGATTQNPISISATCVGLDADTLNTSKQSMGKSFLAAKLSASPHLRAYTKGCDMTLRFRYRGKAVSPSLEVWRKYEVEVKILRVKGPRVPSLSFRCDLFWDSGYTEMCHALAVQDSNRKELGSYEFDLPRNTTDNQKEFVANRLGRDPGIHVCSDQVVVMLSVANESASPIELKRADGASFGFSSSQMDTLKVPKGVSVKFPVLLPRVDRSEHVCRDLIDMTKFSWKSCIPGSEPDDAQETGGPMFPANRRVREGVLELPVSCLKTIIEENPIFLSRICKPPCLIGVCVGNGATVGKPLDVSVTVELAEWLSPELRKRTKGVLGFCCARQHAGMDDENKENQALAQLESDASSFGITKKYKTKSHDFVWIGQTRKNMRLGDESNSERATDHTAKIVFLAEGDYLVSACLSLSGNGQSDDGVKEVWLADQAARVRVSTSTKQ